ncbi:GAF domain-containing sensor histidine kinase [Nannocystis radixulma]|uniref:histidine kinase n=1 Tax=Nannocystis radixulma TaxID=2995305 RepID=A0ABT5BID7_9BACT|nr:GAF domain-containing sensor histidine kinase [Nannocystis radixulma]MDC0673148.1 GAF domain-containing sensor histidine kinase [Nannocystis radixulma]
MELAPSPDLVAQRLVAPERPAAAPSEREQAFADLARLATAVLGAPIALIALVDDGPPLLCASAGLDRDDASAYLSFCTFAIQRGEACELADLDVEPQLADHPLVAFGSPLGDGSRVRSLAAAPLCDRDGRTLGVLCVLDDVPRRLGEEQRRGLLALARQAAQRIELDRRERELAEQRAALARARAEALTSARAKDVFLANMGHELRTPLNAILGCAELLREEATAAGLGQLLPDIQTVDRSGRHLVAVIEDILDLARLEAGVPQLRREPVAVAPLAEEMEAAVRPQLRGRPLRWRLALEPGLGDISTDATKLRQILLNLLSNAIKFTAGGEVELAVRLVREGDREFVAFRVADTGIGIAADKLSLLFRDFSQVHDRRHNFGGTGLGLAISRRFARLLGGDIVVDSELGRGSRFTLLLPRA